eukprot:jgi/Chlat1/5327/Chrsp35S08985
MEHYKRLARLVARAFYSGEEPPRTAPKKATDKTEYLGIAVVIVDALTRRQWVKEDELAKDLRMHPKQLRRAIRVLEEEQLVIREHRREGKKDAQLFALAMAATSTAPARLETVTPAPAVPPPPPPSDAAVQEQAEKDAAAGVIKKEPKPHTYTYACLDYTRLVDVVRYRLHRMRRRLKDEAEENIDNQEYICRTPFCGRRYSALDSMRLINPADLTFHCEECEAELFVEGAAGDPQGDDSRVKRRELARDMLARMEAQLKPLLDQVAKVKDLPAPNFGPLGEWAARNATIGAANVQVELPGMPRGVPRSGAVDPASSYFEETQVEVDLGDLGAGGAGANGTAAGAGAAGQPVPKVLPPWMWRESMGVPQPGGTAAAATTQQEEQQDADTFTIEYAAVKQEEGATATSTDRAAAVVMVKQEQAGGGAKSAEEAYREEYIKAYYAAMLARQGQDVAPEAVVAPQPPNMVQVKMEEGAAAAPQQLTPPLLPVKQEEGAAPAHEEGPEGIDWDDAGAPGGEDVDWEDANPAALEDKEFELTSGTQPPAKLEAVSPNAGIVQAGDDLDWVDMPETSPLEGGGVDDGIEWEDDDVGEAAETAFASFNQDPGAASALNGASSSAAPLDANIGDGDAEDGDDDVDWEDVG